MLISAILNIIWAFGVSSRSQSHELQKLKWLPKSKKHVFSLNGPKYFVRLFLWQKKGCFVALRPLECDVQTTCILSVFFGKWTHARWMNACLVSCSCACQHLHQFLLYFRTDYNKSPLNRNSCLSSCLSAVEIPDLEPLHAFGIPIVSIPRAIGFPVQRIPPCPWNSEKPSMVSYWVFSGIAQFYIISFKQSCTYQVVVIE